VGCDFVVSPALVPDMQQIQTGNYTLWIPGCATLSELANAREMGARMMKVFPANLLRPDFISSALSVLPDLKLMPTGGVEPTEESLRSWFTAGAVCVGMGSQLLSKKLIEARDWPALTQTLTRAVATVHQLKNS
jgi:2-dehydro-3-deoxyphosphogluconate aldolase/(4S)-4-hydroxy-2-oxoglutarate aldolase